MRNHTVSVPSSRSSQRGAVLFISLIMLVVLALIGIAGMQVTTLQERMAGNYYTIGRAFENSEWGVRTTENAIQTAVNANGVYVANDMVCANLDMDNWAKNKTATTAFSTYVARIDKCIPGQSSTKWGQPLTSDTTSVYQITTVEPDTTQANMPSAVSMVAVQTVYIP